MAGAVRRAQRRIGSWRITEVQRAHREHSGGTGHRTAVIGDDYAVATGIHWSGRGDAESGIRRAGNRTSIHAPLIGERGDTARRDAEHRIVAIGHDQTLRLRRDGRRLQQVQHRGRAAGDDVAIIAHHDGELRPAVREHHGRRDVGGVRRAGKRQSVTIPLETVRRRARDARAERCGVSRRQGHAQGQCCEAHRIIKQRGLDDPWLVAEIIHIDRTALRSGAESQAEVTSKWCVIARTGGDIENHRRPRAIEVDGYSVGARGNPIVLDGDPEVVIHRRVQRQHVERARTRIHAGTPGIAIETVQMKTGVGEVEGCAGAGVLDRVVE